MYCPKCGDPLKRRSSGELTCERGTMGLSQQLERELTECFVARTRAPRSTPLPFRVGGSWFCPGCAVPMVETEPGLLKCFKYDLSLGEFIHELVELHPHRGTTS